MAGKRSIAATGPDRTPESRGKRPERAGRNAVSGSGGQALRMVYGTKAPCGETADALKRPRNNGLEMEMRKLILGAAAAAMLAGGTVAQAAPIARAAVPVSNSEELGGGGGATVVLGVLAAALLVFLLVQINDQDGKDIDLPTSP
ncbi:MAG: hypothetical protein J0I69_14205 [Altererythrobacter sp.]|nr:hypothetical protein [Altererythrobacter sp.]